MPANSPPSPQPTPIHTSTELGAAIRARRKADGLTLVETAGLTNVGVRFLSELENGKPTVRLGLTLRVLNALGLELYLPAPTHPEAETSETTTPEKKAPPANRPTGGDQP